MMWQGFIEHLLCAKGAAVIKTKTPPILSARSGVAVGFYEYS